MKTFFMISMILLFCTVAYSTEDKNFSPGDKKTRSWYKIIEKQVDQWYQNNSIVGAELLIIVNDKEVVHNVYGWNDKEDNVTLEKNRIFRIRSMTKPFIGTSILMLAEQGKLELSDKASKFLEIYKNTKSEKITISNLLYHTSGFTMGYPRGSIDDYDNLQEAVADLAEKGPKYEPGTTYSYSDGDTATLGLIIQKVTGMPSETYIHKKIFEPLDMNDSYCLLKPGDPNRNLVCSTYCWRDGEFKKYWDNEAPPETPFFRASGGVFSTAKDYAKFLSLWMNKGQLKSTQFLTQDTIENALKPSKFSKKYGMHWEIYHPGPDSANMPVFGHGGSDGTSAIAIPEHNAMVFYFTQSRGTLTSVFMETIVCQAVGYMDAKEIELYELSENAFQKYLGKYKLSNETWIVEKSGQGINFKVNRLVPLHFLPITETRFIHPYMDMSLEFHIDDEGNCNTLTFRHINSEVEGKKH